MKRFAVALVVALVVAAELPELARAQFVCGPGGCSVSVGRGLRPFAPSVSVQAGPVMPFATSLAPWQAPQSFGCSGGFAAPPSFPNVPPSIYLSNSNGSGAAGMQQSPPGYPGGSVSVNGYGNGSALILQQLQAIERRLQWLEGQR